VVKRKSKIARGTSGGRATSKRPARRASKSRLALPPPSLSAMKSAFLGRIWAWILRASPASGKHHDSDIHVKQVGNTYGIEPTQPTVRRGMITCFYNEAAQPVKVELDPTELDPHLFTLQSGEQRFVRVLPDKMNTPKGTYSVKLDSGIGNGPRMEVDDP
jgi:hypothetical protein